MRFRVQRRHPLVSWNQGGSMESVVTSVVDNRHLEASFRVGLIVDDVAREVARVEE